MTQVRLLVGRSLAAIVLTLASVAAFGNAPTADIMNRLGTDMGRGQRCQVPMSEVLLFSQLARDLAQLGSDPDMLQRDFMNAARQAREADVADCPAAVARFDAALDDIYRLNNRQR